ncbi:hypothetical protein H4Q26_001323 [Puccinia striiformis f. sp. tritici PST-130]|nr:hypothetical protein H4Q26_001323 [Puccinia striiformis f. sp. tritici PST-130]
MDCPTASSWLLDELRPLRNFPLHLLFTGSRKKIQDLARLVLLPTIHKSLPKYTPRTNPEAASFSTMPLKKTAWAPWLNAIQKTSAPITQSGPASTSPWLTINGTPLNTNIDSSIATLDLPSTQTTELNSQSTQTTVTLQSVPATQDSSTTPDSQMNQHGRYKGKGPWDFQKLMGSTQKDFWELRGGE